MGGLGSGFLKANDVDIVLVELLLYDLVSTNVLVEGECVGACNV